MVDGLANHTLCSRLPQPLRDEREWSLGWALGFLCLSFSVCDVIPGPGWPRSRSDISGTGESSVTLMSWGSN